MKQEEFFDAVIANLTSLATDIHEALEHFAGLVNDPKREVYAQAENDRLQFEKNRAEIQDRQLEIERARLTLEAKRQEIEASKLEIERAKTEVEKMRQDLLAAQVQKAAEEEKKNGSN